MAKRSTQSILLRDHPELLTGIKARYAESQRHYHTWMHIEQLLDSYEEIKSSIHNTEVTLLAIYYHDAVYQIPGATNEEDSAELFEDQASPHIDNMMVELVKQFIVATKKHELPKSFNVKQRSDCEYFLDIDMSILGTDRNAYMNYAKNIRQEYAVFNDEMYNFGRAKILGKFLERDRIFLTDYYNDKFEIRARENIANELNSLSQGAIS